MFKLRKLLLVLLIVLVSYFSVISQNSSINKLDSLKFLKDSIEYELLQDTLRLLFSADSSINIKAETDYSKNDLEKDFFLRWISKTEYKEFIKNEDSLIFYKPDSVHYVVYGLRRLINRTNYLLQDTTKQALDILFKYFESREIKASGNYLKSTDNLFQVKDSSLNYINDSIANAIRYLLSNIPKDSLNIFFKNSKNDSVLLETSENKLDSIHIRLFDNRGEHAILWVRRAGNDIFTLFLEDGYYLEKAKQQKLVDQQLDVETTFPKLRKIKKVNFAIPLWKLNGMADVKFNQGFVSESWVEGGENSMSALSVFKYSADYTYGKLRNLDTDVEYKLGYLKTGDKSLRKNDDRFEINAKYGKYAINNWYYSALLNFKTQFLIGNDYSNDTIIPVSSFLSPAYLVFSIGLDYKPTNSLTILISPITSKFTIVSDTVKYDQTRFGVGENEKTRKELGAYIKAVSKLKFRNNIFIENKINFFTNYADNPQNIDIDWEADFVVKLTDYIKISVNIHLLYDDDVEIPVVEDGKQVGITKNFQFKEIFGIGFTYTF